MKKAVIDLLVLLTFMTGLASAPAGEVGRIPTPNTTALEMTQMMGNGINLGNSMETNGRVTLGTSADVSAYETYWGQPVTTEPMIAGMKESGFDSIRIPIAWTNMMDYEKGDYTIKEPLMARVQQLVDWSLENDMFVIINAHWDGGWWGKFGSATPATREEALKMYKAMWTQIATRFKDYDGRLIFEGANEELGDRLNDTDVCPDSGALSEDECYTTAHMINQTFVDLIRSTGGNNTWRFLLIAGYDTDIEKTCDERYIMPTDSAKDKLLISVHYYTPWNYCGTTSGAGWGTIADYEEQNRLLGMMKKFTDQGYGVIIGETAVLLKDDGSLKVNSYEFTEGILNNCDYYNYVPMLWDQSAYFVRKELRFSDEDILELFQSRSWDGMSEYSYEAQSAAAKALLDKRLAEAPEMLEGQVDLDTVDYGMAWIMFASDNWGAVYCTSDTYDPTSKSDSIQATDAEIHGSGTYTVKLDFTKNYSHNSFSTGIAFSALAIGNGERLFPGYAVDITEVKINGEPVKLLGNPYTTSDDGRTTRVNLYNSWVSGVPGGVRTPDGKTDGCSPILLDQALMGHVETLEITFNYGPAGK